MEEKAFNDGVSKWRVSKMEWGSQRRTSNREFRA